MVKGVSIMGGSLHNDCDAYLWRGGLRIFVERLKDRFTFIPPNAGVLDRVRGIPGIDRIKRLNQQVFQVRTTATERDNAMNLLRTAMFNSAVHYAYQPQGAEGTVYYLTDKVMVKFHPECECEQIEALLEQYHLKVLKAYEKLSHTYLLQVMNGPLEEEQFKKVACELEDSETLTAGNRLAGVNHRDFFNKLENANPVVVSNCLAEEALVMLAEPNLVNRFYPAFLPEDSYFKRQWHLSAEIGPQLDRAASVNAPEAWDITLGERQVVVAVIDDGFDLEHPDLIGPDKIVHPKDYVDGDAHPFPSVKHGDYHGTPCAGVAVAEINNQGTVGVAPGCALMPVRFPLNADDDLLVEIFRETGAKADVISCSWGPPPVYAPLPTVLAETFTELATRGGPRGNGTVIVFAAANFNAPLNSPGFPNGFTWLDYGMGKKRKTTGPILNGFATHPDVIAVAASSSLNKHAAYSNWGVEVSVAAPSDNFHPLEPRQFVPGRGIWTIDNERYGLGFTPQSDYTGDFGGTSGATPLVAGIAALIRSVNPELTAAEVKIILQDTADKIVDPDPDVVLKTNRGRYDEQGRCDWFGYGKVNAAKAVRAARERKAKSPDLVGVGVGD
jgi:subtilisin family serine protease